MMRSIFACAAVAALAVAAPAAAQQPIVIKFSHVAAPDTPKGQAANEFKRLAENARRAASGSRCIRTARCSRMPRSSTR